LNFFKICKFVDLHQIHRLALKVAPFDHHGQYGSIDQMTASTHLQESPMNPIPATDRFQALDACHQQIHLHLEQLADVLVQIEAQADESQYRQQAEVIEAFFSGSSRQHHAEEEKNVFPALLASDNAELVHAVRTLKQDHGWIEQNWLELAPMLRAIAQGEDWVDMAELKHTVEVFLSLCHDHIVLEETLIYPESKRQFSVELAARVKRLNEQPN
jgi:hemerythrin-like domain-containing protein